MLMGNFCLMEVILKGWEIPFKCVSYYSCDIITTSTNKIFFSPVKSQNIQRKKCIEVLRFNNVP
jgi:hypothetical protein